MRPGPRSPSADESTSCARVSVQSLGDRKRWVISGHAGLGDQDAPRSVAWFEPSVRGQQLFSGGSADLGPGCCGHPEPRNAGSLSVGLGAIKVRVDDRTEPLASHAWSVSGVHHLDIEASQSAHGFSILADVALLEVVE